MRLAGGLAGLLVLGLPGSASAHMTVKGIGAFYGGVLHPLMVVPQVMVVIGLALLLGQKGFPAGRAALVGFFAMLAGALAAGVLGLDIGGETPVLAVAASTGLLVAAGAAPYPGVAVVAALAAGLVLGLDSAPEAQTPARAAALMAGGVWLGASLAVLLLADLCARLKPAPFRIGMRVAASWIAASALLVLALHAAPLQR